MTWDQALEIVVARTGHERYRELCRADHPRHQAWRAEMVRQAGGGEAYPSVMTQTRNALQAAGRFVASGFATVDRAEYDRRRAICGRCEHLDPAQDRCRKCGCYLAVKPWGAREKCPLGKWLAAGDC